jgi:hypothetical protein
MAADRPASTPTREQPIPPDEQLTIPFAGREDDTVALGRDDTVPLGRDETVPLGEDDTLRFDDRRKRH